MGQLAVLSWEELETRVRGEVGAWDRESLRAAVRADHGYKDSSPQLGWLLNVMAVPPRPAAHQPPHMAVRKREEGRGRGGKARVPGPR